MTNSKSSMEERRRFKRRHLIFYSRIFDRKTGGLLGHLVDISPVGLMVISEEPIATDVPYLLRMDIPEEVSVGKTFLVFEAMAVWCRPDIDPSFYDTGFEFTTPDPQAIKIIEQMVSDYGFRD